MQTPDLVILGGGPAGAVSAILAAREGLRATLVDPMRPRPRIEGLSPRLRAWLHGQGLLAGLELFGPLPRRARWSGLESAANAETLVCRAALDSHLRAAAGAAGAELVEGSGALAPVPGGARLTLPDGRGWEAPFGLDARGRAARGGARRAGTGFRAPPTVSLCAWVSGAAAGPAGASVTAIPEGWVWTAALPDGRIWAQFTCDAADPAPAGARLRAALAAADARFAAADLALEGLSARETAPVLPGPVADLRLMPVGDAFSAMDPLSGHGQFWAVSSALAAAAARRTLTARPGAGTEALLRRFLTGRAAETCLRNARLGRDFLALETRFAQAPFWARRRGFPDDLPAHEIPEAIEIARAPAVRDGLVEEIAILRTPRTPTGLGWLGAIPAAEAWAMLQAGAGREDLIARFGPEAQGLPERLEAEKIPATGAA